MYVYKDFGFVACVTFNFALQLFTAFKFIFYNYLRAAVKQEYKMSLKDSRLTTGLTKPLSCLVSN
jgi:hypothetical protein